MPKTVKGGPLRFLTTILLQNFKKLKGDPLESLENFRKKMRNFNSPIVPKNLKKGPFGVFNIRSLQNIKQIGGRALWGH